LLTVFKSSNVSSATSSHTARTAASTLSSNGGSAGGGSPSPSIQLQGYINAPFRNDPWSTYVKDMKRTERIISELDDILDKLQAAGNGSAGGVGSG